jgi:hypothetical protein
MLRAKSVLAVAAAATALLIPATTSQAHAQQVPGWGYQAPEGRGCYWHRQQYFCARYCYFEVDGRRYCVERERDAYPQGVWFDNSQGWDARSSRPLKLGVGTQR